jgi:hypothetical protein
MLWENAPQTLGANENFFLTPIFIQNYNQLSYLQKLLNWLLAAGYKNICIIDNNSTYDRLLQFYTDAETNHAVKLVRRNTNGSRTTLWEEQVLERFGVTGPFVYTDSDIVPEEFCPADLVGRLASHLRNHPQIFKAGLGLRIDDLPAHYRFRSQVVAWEKQFWMAPVGRGVFLSQIDTTFGLYRPNSAFAMSPALRTGYPYLGRHEPWYQDSENLTDEQRYYVGELEKTARGHWSRTRLPQWLEAEAAKRQNSDVKLLHLGCGNDIMPGWINLDRASTAGADIVFDLETCAEARLPIESDSVDGIYMCHAFQQIEAVVPMMQELHRIAKADARFIIRLPHGASDNAVADPTQRHRYLPDNFSYFAQPAHAAKDDDYAGDWSVKRVKLVVDQGLIGAECTSSVLARASRERNLVEEMIVELRCVKPARPRQHQTLECPAPTISTTGFDPESVFQAHYSP